MNTRLHIIHQKISAIEFGLLRYRHNDTKLSLSVQITTESNEILHCRVNEDILYQCLLNKPVSLVQKDRDNYIYVDGYISKITGKEKDLMFTINIRKAFWFIRKRKGAVTSLYEKSFYEANHRIRLAS